MMYNKKTRDPVPPLQHMPLTLEQYAEHLDGRADLNWPMPPEVGTPRAKPHLKQLPGVRAITWSLYGTLLIIPQGRLLLEHPNAFIMEVTLEKTVQEFKMWKSMSRKAMKPGEQLLLMIKRAIDETQFQTGSIEKYPELCNEKIWEVIVNRLMQNEYIINQSHYGPLEEFSKKISYFYHRSLQGTACFPEAAETLAWANKHLEYQGIYADAQCFSMLQLERGLKEQNSSIPMGKLIPSSHRILSCEVKGRKPSEHLLRELLISLKDAGIDPAETLHVGTNVETDLIPLKRMGFKTALFAGDRHSIQADPEQLKDKATRPDVMLTHLSQIKEVVAV